MDIPDPSPFRYAAVVRRNGRSWTGTAEDDGSASLLGSRPSISVTNGRVTLARRSPGLNRSLTDGATFDGGDALSVVLGVGDRLSCWQVRTAEIGLSVFRSESLVLALGTLECAGGAICIDCDPRVEESWFARRFRFVDGPGTRIIWLDPHRPRELKAGLKELDGDFPDGTCLAIIVRTDSEAVRDELNRQTMPPRQRNLGSVSFLTAAERFSCVDEWLQYGRALSPERPKNLWLRIRTDTLDAQVPQGRTVAVSGWLVHVLRVFEPGTPARQSQLGLVRIESGVTPSMLERSVVAVAAGLRYP